MSEENQSVEEVVTDATEQSAPVSPDAGLIAESKKYRTRAQTAEAELGKLQKKLDEQANATLKENEEWKTLADKREQQLNEALPYKEKYEAQYSANIQRLLSKFPEEQREKYKGKDPEWLESLLEAQGKNDFTETSERASVPKNQEFGGYGSYAEWAQRDPDGYTKSNNTLQGTNVKIAY